MTRFDTSSDLQIGSGTETDGDRDRKSYRFPWQHDLRDIREHSVISWARKVENAYAQLEPNMGALKARTEIYKQAISAALHGDGRMIGRWDTPKALDMAKLSDAEIAARLKGRTEYAAR